jgi:hypothetical protein
MKGGRRYVRAASEGAANDDDCRCRLRQVFRYGMHRIWSCSGPFILAVGGRLARRGASPIHAGLGMPCIPTTPRLLANITTPVNFKDPAIIGVVLTSSQSSPTTAQESKILYIQPGHRPGAGIRTARALRGTQTGLQGPGITHVAHGLLQSKRSTSKIALQPFSYLPWRGRGCECWQDSNGTHPMPSARRPDRTIHQSRSG